MEQRQQGGQKRNLPRNMQRNDYDDSFQEQMNSDLYKKETYYEDGGDSKLEENNDEMFKNIDNIRGKLSEWIKRKETQRYIKNNFQSFLQNYMEDGKKIYIERIKRMCEKNEQSLVVNYQNLSDTLPTIAYWIFESPTKIFKYLSQVVYKLACQEYLGFE